MQTLRLDSNTEATVANTLPQELEDYDLRPYIEQIDKVFNSFKTDHQLVSINIL